MGNQLSVWIYWSPGQENRLDAMCANVKMALAGLGLDPSDLALWLVSDEESARQRRVLGTPSVKVDGIDVEQDLMMYEQCGVWPRKYMEAGCEIPAPRTAIIREAIIDALARRRIRREQRP